MTRRNFIELSSEYKAIEKALNEELLPDGASLEQLRTLYADIESLNGKKIGVEWSIESNGDDVMVFHNNYADNANLSEIWRQKQAEVMSPEQLGERNSASHYPDPYADFDLSQDNGETRSQEYGGADHDRPNMAADVLSIKTDDHIALCAKDDLLYVLEKWIRFIEE